MEEVQLAGCVITNHDNQVLLMHRADHNQWELPGGRVEDGELAIQAAAREVHMRLGVVVNNLRVIGEATFSQGFVDYHCEWFHSTSYRGSPWIVEPQVYDKWQYVNLMRRGIGHIGLSPNVQILSKRLTDDGMNAIIL